MSILNCFRRKKASANVAKERLQIIIAHERQTNRTPTYWPQLQKEIVDVIAKYIDINKEQVNIQLQRDGGTAVLELNVPMPEQALEKDLA